MIRKTGDCISVKNLLAKSVVGPDAWRRNIPQPLRIKLGINVGARLKRMALTDDLRKTLNYDSLSAEILNRVESQNFKNTEELATHVIKTIQGKSSTGESSQVEVCQPKGRLLAKSRELIVSSENNVVFEAVKGLNLPTIIGVNNLERIHPQIVELDSEVIRKASTEVFTHDYVEELAKYSQESKFLTIESYCNAMAEKLCFIDSVQRAVVTAAKPSALNFAESAQIRVERVPGDFIKKKGTRSHERSNIVYLAFGTNQGETSDNIRSSIDELEKRGIEVLQTSGIYMSEPMYYTEQPPFFNGVFRCSTELSPLDLLKCLKEIEYGTYGRVKKFDNGPRTMDLDIISYNDAVFEDKDLTIPHIDMLNRSFVLKPLNDVVPGSTALNPAYPEAANLNGREKRILPLHVNLGTCGKDTPNYLEIGTQTSIMAIMNATPDSFSDGGDLSNVSIAETAAQHLRDGATILDIGGQSTRPGAAWVGKSEEIRRVCSAIRSIRESEDTANAVISVDTCWGSVAKAALDSGANIINDVFSGAMDPSILEVAANSGCPIILSHARGDPKSMKDLATYPEGVVEEVAHELRERVDAALKAGCKMWQIILDPGLGFAKTGEQNLELIRKFSESKTHPVSTNGLSSFPWLVGPSRKGFIGSLTKESNPKNRVYGTVAVSTALAQQGAEIVRVHDTKPAWQALKMADAIYKEKE